MWPESLLGFPPILNCSGNSCVEYHRYQLIDQLQCQKLEKSYAYVTHHKICHPVIPHMWGLPPQPWACLKSKDFEDRQTDSHTKFYTLSIVILTLAPMTLSMKFVIQWSPVCGVHLYNLGRDWTSKNLKTDRQTDRQTKNYAYDTLHEICDPVTISKSKMTINHLNPPKQNYKEILEKTSKNFAKWTFYISKCHSLQENSGTTFISSNWMYSLF